MKFRSLFLALSLAVTAGAALAETPAPRAIDPASAEWSSPAGLAGVSGAWLIGGQDQPGPYQFRITIEKDGRIPPHTHPDTRNSTVLSGTLYVGFGEHFDETAMVAIPEGHLYVAPANVPHYLWARDGQVTYQESGAGPSGTRLIKHP